MTSIHSLSTAGSIHGAYRLIACHRWTGTEKRAERPQKRLVEANGGADSYRVASLTGKHLLVTPRVSGVGGGHDSNAMRSITNRANQILGIVAGELLADPEVVG